MIEKQDYSSFKSAVGNSTKTDPYAAGKETAEKTLQKLACKPDFVFLFCTTHYKENDGLKKLLKGVWSILPENTTLLGGTIAGFQNQEGCFARGATMLAVNYPNMNISSGYGKNIKRNPQKAARKCYKMIKQQLKNDYRNKILFTFSPPAETLELPGFGKSININSKILGRLMLPLFYIIQKVFQRGLGTEQEFLEELKKFLPEYYFLHGSTINSFTYGTSYQFFNKEVLTETGVALTIELDIKTDINYKLAVEKIDVDFNVTKKSRDKKIIKKINNKPALKELIRLMNWPAEEIKQDRWLTTSLTYPFGYYKNNKLICRSVPMVLGNYMGCFGKVESENIFMLRMSQSKIVESAKSSLPDKEPIMGFIISCISRQQFAGIKIFEVNKIFKDYFKEKPFFVIYTGGEGMGNINEEPLFLNQALITTVFVK